MSKKGQHEEESEHRKRIEVGNQILTIIEDNLTSPSEALLLMQQLTIFIWNHYNLDWQSAPNFQVADSRKQRFLDFVGELIDNTEYQEPEIEAA